jgi:hypothetical protein
MIKTEYPAQSVWEIFAELPEYILYNETRALLFERLRSPPEPDLN